MTPEASLPVVSSQSELSVPPSSLTREALVEQFAVELQKLEPLCLPPLKMEQHSLLCFRCEEFADVNAAWKNGGINAVTERWGAERTFACGKPGTLRHPPSPPPSDAQYPLILAVYDFAPDPSPNPVQMNYYRSRNFDLSTTRKNDIRTTLESSGILERFSPHTDSVTQASLSDASIEDISCSCQWYGRENLYGDGVALKITLTLLPPGREAEYLRLTVDERGVMERSLWTEDFLETGYEGHEHLSKALTVDELRALLPIIAKLHSETPEVPHRHTTGTWIAHSSLPVD
jgi:hypothetical protein